LKHVLITGGCGFIGGHAIEHWLVKTDWRITSIDALRFAGDANGLTRSTHYDPSRVRLFWHDLRAPVPERLVQKVGAIDYLVNMASDSHVARSLEDPVPFVENNVSLALNVLEYARKARPEKFIQISTDEVFGPAPEGISYAENAALRPSNPYSASKACQEMIATSYWRSFGVPLIITRTMNNFGERQLGEKFVPMAIAKVLQGEKVMIHARRVGESWNPGSRVWLHARNHADALTYVLQEADPVTYRQGGVPVRFNVAGEREADNLEIAETIAEIVGKPLRYEFEDYHSSRPGHDLRYSLDGSAIRAAGWNQPMMFEESFEKTVRWYIRNPSALGV
jgi:dTDP-glucose 4,6-dehydratase